MAPVRKPYSGEYRKLVIAFDVGTTYSGASYALLDPGLVPEIQGVTRYPAQERVGGDAKIPSILYYNKDGTVRAVGAEAEDDSFLNEIQELEDEDDDFAEVQAPTRVEWFKLHLRPKGLSASHIKDKDLPPLPAGKAAIDVFADYLGYLYKCTRAYIEETHPSGASLWDTVAGHLEFILTHPNGWEGQQQSAMRHAAVKAGLIQRPDADNLHFVTEGEASLHFCVSKGITDFEFDDIKRIIIVDAGGGTIDLSAYARVDKKFEEIAPPQCRLQGSVFVNGRAKEFLKEHLVRSRYGNDQDIDQMMKTFDKSTKRSWRNKNDPAFIRFGSGRDRDPSVGIRNGQLRLTGDTMATFFEPTVNEIMECVDAQISHAAGEGTVDKVFLVGGFAASEWLSSQLQARLSTKQISLCRPDGHINKAVPDGAISFFLDRMVSVRVSKFTYGVGCYVTYNPLDPEHRAREFNVFTAADGRKGVDGCFSSILGRGVKVGEEQEFRSTYYRRARDLGRLRGVETEILCYRGIGPAPNFKDKDADRFSVLCTVTADTSELVDSLNPKNGLQGRYYELEFDIVFLFGLTELKAQISWKEKGLEKRGPAKVVFDKDLELEGDTAASPYE